jgi:Ca2+/Na+ antiporter
LAQRLGGPRGRLDEREVGSLLTLVEFGLALAAILVAASLFTNAVEILGARLGLQQGGVGSVLAAVGTALPETIILIVAILESVFTGKALGIIVEGAHLFADAVKHAAVAIALHKSHLPDGHGAHLLCVSSPFSPEENGLPSS